MVASVQKRTDGPGQARLEVSLVYKESTVISAFATSPMKVLVPRSRGQSVWAYTSSFGGGLVAGDQTRLELILGDETRCFMGTQASTKIYRNPHSRPCGHVTEAHLGAGALLVFAPDPIQAFEESIYHQSQIFHLASNSGLVLVDWFSAGRAAHGERWAFALLSTRNEVFIAGERVFLDSLRLDPADGAFDCPSRGGRINCMALLAMLGRPLKDLAARAADDVGGKPVGRRAATICSASPHEYGAVLRFAGESTEAVAGELRRHLSPLTQMLGDDPWQRKW